MSKHSNPTFGQNKKRSPKRDSTQSNAQTYHSLQEKSKIPILVGVELNKNQEPVNDQIISALVVEKQPDYFPNFLNSSSDKSFNSRSDGFLEENYEVFVANNKRIRNEEEEEEEEEPRRAYRIHISSFLRRFCNLVKNDPL